MSMEPTTEQISKVLAQWTNAESIRYEGKCDLCKRPTLLSLQLPGDNNREDGWESCGYYCTGCGWSNAGARLKIDRE